MLEAIQNARQTLSFVTYIFDRDEVGMAFAHALGEAARRGVEVRVLIDATGTRYSWPTILHTLRQERVKHARFLPSFALWHLMSMNLRTHRKILVADGRVGSTGGMNIRVGHCLQRQPPHPVQDIHFRVTGPVVTQMQEVFADDWLFTTGEDSWFYFVHSYYVAPADRRISAGESTYGIAFTCVVASDNIFATQFHPEKSSAAGLRIYETFTRWNP